MVQMSMVNPSQGNVPVSIIMNALNKMYIVVVLQIYNFLTKINVDSTGQNGINLQATFGVAPPSFHS